MGVPLARFARMAVAAGLTAFVLWKADPAEVLRAGGGTDVSWLAVAVGLVLIDRALMAYRWLVLLRTLEPGTRPPLGAIIRIFFLSTFVGTFLPSVGGDVVRAYSLSRYNVSVARAGASVLMDRLLGIASIMLVGVVGVLLAGPEFADRGVVLTLALALLACAAAALVLFTRRGGDAGRALATKVPTAAARRAAGSLFEATRRYGGHHRDLANVLIGSLAVQVLRILQAYCLGRALGLGIPLPVYFAFIPLILLIMLLPITVNGLGTSQVAFVWFFGQAGVPEPAAFALSVLFVALGIVGNLPGGLLYALSRGPRQTAVPGVSERR